MVPIAHSAETVLSERGGVLSASQTIVRQVRGGSDPAGHRFVILAETELSKRSFTFSPIGAEMTMTEVCAALTARGVAHQEVLALLNDAVASFHQGT